MDTRLYASIAVQDNQNRVTSVNLAALFTSLLLFDTFILESVWLEDLILLQHSFGPAGLAELLEAGALKFHFAGLTFGQTGQALTAIAGQPSLPLFTYQFSTLSIQGAEDRIQQTLSNLDSKLREQLVKGRILEPPAYKRTMFDAFFRDLNSGLLDSVVRIELRRNGIIPVDHDLEVTRRSDDEFSVTTDLPKRYSLSPLGAHRLIEKAMMDIGRLDHHATTMQAYSTLTVLSEKDEAILQAKLGSLAKLVQTSTPTPQLSRVVKITGLPLPVYGSTVINVRKLLKVRESDEYRGFKAWLSGAESLSDNEIRERAKGLGGILRHLAVHSTPGKALRFVLSTGLGYAVGAVSGPLMGMIGGAAISMADQYLLEKLLPKDSVISFLNETYPSLLKR